MPERLFFASKWFFFKRTIEVCFESLSRDQFFALQVSFEKIYYGFSEKPDKLFWTKPKEEIFVFLGKWLEHLESREILCVLYPKVLVVSAGRRYKTLREWIRCL